MLTSLRATRMSCDPNMLTSGCQHSRYSFLTNVGSRSQVIDLGTTLCEVPFGTKPIPLKWRGKHNPVYGNVPARLKGRLTAVTCSQRPGIDYGETFAPVNCREGESFCIFLSIVATWKFGGGPDLYQDCFPHRWSRLTHLHDSTWRVCGSMERRSPLLGAEGTLWNQVCALSLRWEAEEAIYRSGLQTTYSGCLCLHSSEW